MKIFDYKKIRKSFTFQFKLFFAIAFILVFFLICVHANAISIQEIKDTCVMSKLYPYGGISSQCNLQQFSYNIAIASAYEGTYTPSKAFDGSVSTAWVKTGVGSGWILQNYTTGHKITQAHIDANEGWAGDFGPIDFSIDASNDGLSYTSLGSWTSQSWTAGVFNNYTFVNPNSYQIYRLNIGRAATSGIGAMEIQYWGC